MGYAYTLMRFMLVMMKPETQNTPPEQIPHERSAGMTAPLFII